jgi:hypothetical protein
VLPFTCHHHHTPVTLRHTLTPLFVTLRHTLTPLRPSLSTRHSSTGTPSSLPRSPFESCSPSPGAPPVRTECRKILPDVGAIAPAEERGWEGQV